MKKIRSQKTKKEIIKVIEKAYRVSAKEYGKSLKNPSRNHFAQFVVFATISELVDRINSD